MTLQVVGAGLPRTGTTSLKLAVERLVGGRCYHMADVYAYPEHIRVWHDAVGGHPPDWGTFLAGYRAAVDLPASAFWRELAAHNSDTVIVLSVRDSAEQWWDSWSHTIVTAAARRPPAGSLFASYAAMTADLLHMRLGVANPADEAEMMAAYERHNDAVRAGALPARLLEWRPADGWAPLAERLGVPVPDEPFPCANTRAQFRVPEFGTMAEWAQAR